MAVYQVADLAVLSLEKLGIKKGHYDMNGRLMDQAAMMMTTL